MAVKVVPLVLESGADHILDQLETLHGSEHEGIVDFKGAFYRSEQPSPESVGDPFPGVF